MIDNEYPTYDVISEEDKKQFLLKKGYPFFGLAIGFAILSLFMLITGNKVLFYFFFMIALLGIIKGLFPLLFWNDDQKRDYITSKLYQMNLEYQKKNGISYSSEELDRMRFENDPLFRQKIITKIHKEEDSRYKKSVDDAKNNLIRLQTEYDRRYKQISDARWERLGEGVTANPTEGKVIINGSECSFSSIRGAKVINQTGNRRETYEHEYTEEHKEEKRNLSVGGAIVGGLVAGPLGAVAGGIALGKNKSETVHERKSDIRHRDIPVCNHLGVSIDLDGFETEVTLISSQVDQASYEYRRKLDEANRIVSSLRVIASTPMPRNYLLVEQEPELVLLYEDINSARESLRTAKNNKPTYQIPDRYLNIPDQEETSEEEEIIDLTSDESTINMSRRS